MSTKFRVYGLVTGTKFLGVFEANTPEEAKEMAAISEENFITLCHQCSREVELDDIGTTGFIVEIES